MPTQPKPSLQSKAPPHPRPASPTPTESENEEFRVLIERAIAWKLMLKEDNCATVLPNRLLRLAASAKETGRTRSTLYETLDKIILIAKILQEWSWKDKADEWRKEMMEHMEEEIITRTSNVNTIVDGIAREAQSTWKKIEEMAGKVTEISTKIATLGNTIPDGRLQTGEEEGEISNGTPGASYANAVRANTAPPRAIQHHQHNSAVKEAEMKD
ncbi:hypothetical protein FB446DRAFT_794671 [Lentinula raphanica]|nr:hypothetical protein FB446DRAFT_794671 [Lentinula raphanica]